MNRISIAPIVGAFIFATSVPTIAAAAELPATAEPLDRVVAVVDESIITARQLEAQTRIVQQQILERGSQPPTRERLQSQVLDSLIFTQAQLNMAERSGIRIDELSVDAALRNLAQQNRVSLERFRQVLEEDGFDYNEFRQRIRGEMIIGRLRQKQINNRVVVSEREIDNYIERHGTPGSQQAEYRLGHILVTTADGATPEEVAAAETRALALLKELRDGGDFSATATAESQGQQALDGGDLGWRKAGELPTLFADSVVALNVGEMAGPFRSSSGFHLIKLLEKRGEARRLVTQTLSRHILIRPNELISDNEAKNRLAGLKARIESGDDFAELAKAHSDDRGSAVEGGLLPWSAPGKFVPAFDAALAELEINAVSEPFRSQFGWHIAQVLERRDYDDTEEFQRNQARQIVFRRKVEEETEIWLRRLRDEAYVEQRLSEDREVGTDSSG